MAILSWFLILAFFFACPSTPDAMLSLPWWMRGRSCSALLFLASLTHKFCGTVSLIRHTSFPVLSRAHTVVTLFVNFLFHDIVLVFIFEFSDHFPENCIFLCTALNKSECIVQHSLSLAKLRIGLLSEIKVAIYWAIGRIICYTKYLLN